jgi:DNA gyrase subunit A
MVEIAKEVVPVNIETELKQSYLDYAMSVIVGRALPDVRDGLKPVHRRVLFAMNELGLEWNKPYKKSARVVGDVIGKYHPHGDSAVYDTIVRMAQPFSLRYMLVDGQGNFGSIDGDSAAAMRYTEIRMRKIAHDLLADLDKETVDFVPNYDGQEMIPDVLPTRVPNLLINGSSGIAVGMATNIPPHNLGEVVRACLALIDNPDATVDDLMAFVPGPDFPTGGIINGRAGILLAYRTGRGRIYVRARAQVEVHDKTGRESIIITEVPYMVNKARLIEKIAELVKEKKLEGISEIRDESDKDGLRVVIDIKRGDMGEVVLNNLYAQTQMETVFGINNVALVDGQPKTLNLLELMQHFIQHRREVVTRRTIYLLRKARERGHVLEGLAVAIANIDEVITTIKASATPQDAKEALISRGWPLGAVSQFLARLGSEACRPDDLPAHFGVHGPEYFLSPEQVQAILDLRLHRLTGMEHDKLLAEYEEKLNNIGEYLDILSQPTRLMGLIRDELVVIEQAYGDARRTEITASREDLRVEDLINVEDRVVTISHGGYAKSQPLDAYQAQRRGGMGKSATSVKDEDFVEHLLIANTHDYILCFTNRGKVFWLKTYEIPVAGRQSRGRPMVNLLPLGDDERVTSVLPVKEFDANHYIFMATAAGTVKKTSLDQFAKPRTNGLIAIELLEGDTLVGTDITDGNCDVLLMASNGKATRFNEQDVRPLGRTSRGMRGMRFDESDRVIAMIIPKTGGKILTISQNGYGKRTEENEFPTKGRGGQGVIAMQMSDRNGPLCGAVQVFDGDEIMIISDQGTLVRTRVDEVSIVSRNTQGVRLIKTKEGEHIVGLCRIEEQEDKLDADTTLDSEDTADE